MDRRDVPDADVEALARLMMAWTGMAMKQSRGSEDAKAMAAMGLTLQQIVALHVLMFEGATSVSALTDRLDLSVSATSHLVQRMVEQGLVVREEDPADRRSRRVSLAKAGKKLVEKMMQSKLHDFRRSVSVLSPPLRRDLHSVLERVVAEMSALPTPESRVSRVGIKIPASKASQEKS